MKKKLIILALLSCTISLLGVNRKSKTPPQVVKEAAAEVERPRIPEKADVAAIGKRVKKLSKEAAAHFKEGLIGFVCRDFGHNLRWWDGNIFVFVLGSKGNILVHGDDTELIWKNLKDVKGVNDPTIIDQMFATGLKGGWVNYSWHNGFKTSYVQKVEKDGIPFIVGAGFFPDSHEYQAKNLVKRVITSIRQYGPKPTFNLMNNPYGPFVDGDIYSFAYDLEGNVFADGDNPALVDQNLLDLKDSRGKSIVKDFIEIAKSTVGKGWIDYVWKNEPKKSYIQFVKDVKLKNKQFFIGAGYYPKITMDEVVTFVRRAIKHLQDVGAKNAFSDFTNPVGEYIRGGLTIYAYDLQGKNLADGENPAFVGQDFLKRKDPDGKLVIKEMVETASKFGKGTVTFLNKNAYKLLYFEKVDVPDGKFIIGSGYYPASKPQFVESTVNKAVEFLSQGDTIEAWRQFSDPTGEFFHGDIYLFVYSQKGTRIVAGPQNNIIWQNFYREKDEQGFPIVENLISLAMSGGGWTTYKSRNAWRRIYVKAVEKIDKHTKVGINYILGSGFYL